MILGFRTDDRPRLLILLATALLLGLNAALLAAQAVPGDEYYVDSVNGSDSNPGTSVDAPWQTLAPVRDRAFQPGDVVHFKRGSSWTVTDDWRGLFIDDSGVEGNPISFTAYGEGGKPVFRNPEHPDNYTNAITIGASWVILEGVLVQDTTGQGVRVDGDQASLVQAMENASEPLSEPAGTRCLRLLGHSCRGNR